MQLRICGTLINVESRGPRLPNLSSHSVARPRTREGLPTCFVPTMAIPDPSDAGPPIPPELRFPGRSPGQRAGGNTAPGTGASVTRGVTGWAIAGNFAFGVGGMVLVGYALERFIWPTAAPWIMLGCALAGLLGGGYRFVKEGIDANKAFTASRAKR